MAFTLTGVTNERGLRRFTFEQSGSGPPRITVVVFADLALVRKYDIPLQELPLLCVRFLEGGTAGATGSVAFSEKEMIEYANRRSLAKDLAKQRKRPFRPSHPHPGRHDA